MELATEIDPQEFEDQTNETEQFNEFEDEDEISQKDDSTSKKNAQMTKEKPKKKRTKKVVKRKKAEQSSDEEEDESEEQNGKKEKKKRKKKVPNKKQYERRNIRDVLSTDKLEATTLNALQEEQQRLQRLQQAQRDAYANEVLKEFDLDQLGDIKEEADFEGFEPSKFDLDPTLKPPELPLPETQIKPDLDQPIKSDTIDLSSDEDKTKTKVTLDLNTKAISVNGVSINIPSSTTAIRLPPKPEQPKKEADSDSSDIQILSEHEESDDDPDNSGMHTNDKLNSRTSDGKVIVNISEKKPDNLIYVADSIQGVIKPHQIGGVRFLYDNIIESPSIYERSQGFGCILAHAMGLGKTLQVVTFTDVFLKATKGRHVLCIVPINTIQNWCSEFKHWLPDEPFKVHLMSDSLKTITQRSVVITNWEKEGGVLLMGYEMFRLLAGTKAQQRKKKIPKKRPLCIDIEEEDKEKDILVDIRKILIDPGPDLVICDEGHRIKNAHASISQVLKAVRTRRRVVLTGYPLQNNLLEYWCMVDFVRPNYLGTKTEFSNMFERPIQNGQCVDSTPRDTRLMMHRAHVLHNLLKGFVQRRSHRVLRKNLPPKYEHVLLVKMTPFQRKLYATFTEDLLAQKSVANPLKAFAVCCKIWNHPDVLCNFLRKKADEDEDLELEELASNKTNKNGKKSKGVASKKSKRVDKSTNKIVIPPSKQPNNSQQGFNPQNNAANGHYQNPNFQQNQGSYSQFPQNQYYSAPFQQQQNQMSQQNQMMSQQHQNQIMSQQNQMMSQQNQMMSQQFSQQQQQYSQYSQYSDPMGYGSQQGYSGYDESAHSNNGMMQQNQMMDPQDQDGMSQHNQMMGGAQQPHQSQLRQHLMSGHHQNNGQPPLNLLQQHVEQVPMDKMLQNGHQSPHINGNHSFEIPTILENEGPGFDHFSTRDPEKKDEISYEWANGMFNDYVTGLAENSNKFVIFFKLLEETIKVEERILLFSQSLLTLDLIESFLQQRTVPVSGEKWCNNVNYFRLDGSTNSSERDRLINAFNKAEPLQIPLFLVSTRAGSLGINLVGANRVVIFDASWNPCHDSQAVCRVYRYGQIKPCYIYRLVSDKCLEKKIYDRQVNKQGMSNRVVDEANPDNYLSTKDIHSLWGDEDFMREVPDTPWNVDEFVKKCQNFGDQVLAQLLIDQGTQSLSIHPFTHESLLVDRKDKKLTRIEKRIAERSYEAEKTAQISYSRPSYAAFYPKQMGGRDHPEMPFEGSPNKSQNFIGCRKETWRPPPMEVEDDFEPMSHLPARAHPNYNGMGIPSSSSGHPSTSQPLHARPPGYPNKRFPIEALARREGVKLQEVLVPRDILIPTKNHNPIALRAGQRVMLIKTPKGVYLRYRDQIVKIRVPNGLLPVGGSGSPLTGSRSNSPNSTDFTKKQSMPSSTMTTNDSNNKPDVVTLHSSGEDD